MRNKSKAFLSKSKYKEGLQCSKLLWYEYHDKSVFPPISPSLQAIFDSGKKVGEVAQQRFPGGIKIERDLSPEKHHAKSIDALKLGKPLFEAGFVFGQAYALADILVPVKNDLWDLYEVKSSTELTDEHRNDVAFQKYTYENAGIKIRKCFLTYINNQYVRQGGIEPDKLFISEDVTVTADGLLKNTVEHIKRMLEVIVCDKIPDIKIGPHCNTPYECALKGLCWKFLPAENSVFTLSRGGKKCFKLAALGIYDISSIPVETKLSDNQHIQVECHRSGKPYIDRPAVNDFLKRLKYPLYFLDFETINPAIPLYDNSRPYEQIPFQFSLHVLPNAEAEPTHHAYLAEGTADPRQEVLKKLKGLLGDSGTIVAYNANFEIDRLEDAVEAYPEFKKWFSAIEKRFVDLWTPFRSFAYYHPGQQGSASMKDVLPALAGISYEGMEISNGVLASNEYYRVTFDSTVPEKERLRVRSALEKYCALDTKGMIDIVQALRKELGEIVSLEVKKSGGV